MAWLVVAETVAIVVVMAVETVDPDPSVAVSELGPAAQAVHTNTYSTTRPKRSLRPVDTADGLAPHISLLTAGWASALHGTGEDAGDEETLEGEEDDDR